jgi:hypothetical protein
VVTICMFFSLDVSEVLHHSAANPGVGCWALLLPCWVGMDVSGGAVLLIPT